MIRRSGFLRSAPERSGGDSLTYFMLRNIWRVDPFQGATRKPALQHTKTSGKQIVKSICRIKSVREAFCETGFGGITDDDLRHLVPCGASFMRLANRFGFALL